VNAPTTLRRNGRRRVIEILVFSFKKAVVDLVKFVAENLLRRLIAVRRGVRCEEYSVLILVKKLSRHTRLAAEFTNACCDVNVHVWITIETLGDVGQVLRVGRVKGDEVSLRMSLYDTVSRLLQLRVAGKVLAVERPVGMRAQLFISFVETVRGQEKRFGI